MKTKASLMDLFPEIAKEWDYTKNKNDKPEEVAPHSNKKFWWLCPAGHEYQTTVDKRTGRGDSCPYCSGKKVLTGYNDLQSQNPQLASEWDYEKNVSIKPDSIALHSNKLVWWKCSECKYEWQAKINDRANGRGCPSCSKKKRILSFRENNYLLRGENDVATVRPDLAVEWDKERNENLLPSDFTCGSSQKIWWRCSVCGHLWKATISNRAKNNSGCPKCFRYSHTSFPEQAMYYYIYKLFPDVINGYTGAFGDTKTELDIYIPSLATGIEYDGVAWHSDARSKRKSIEKYQVCQKNDITLIRVSEINDNTSCDYFVFRGDLSFSGLDQAIVSVISYLTDSIIIINTEKDRNDILIQYVGVIKSKSITFNYPDATSEWDYERNSGITPEMVNATTSQKFWWKCNQGHSYQASPNNKLRLSQGCPYCSNHKLLFGFNDLATRYPSIAAEWDEELNSPTKASDVMPGSTQKYWWKCPAGHSYYSSPNIRTSNKQGCPICGNHKVLTGFNDFLTKNPITAEKWDYEKNGDLQPNSILPGSGIEVWWKCPEGHRWKKKIREQIKHDFCPLCSGKIIVPGVNDLLTLYPDLAKEWNVEKNGGQAPINILPSSTKKAWWVCNKCKTEWQAPIHLRVLYGHGCPKCAYTVKMQKTRERNIILQKKSLADLCPDIAAEWDYEKNTDLDPTRLSPGSNKKVWWVCKNGHHYEAWITDRTGKHKTGCPYCARKRKLII